MGVFKTVCITDASKLLSSGFKNGIFFLAIDSWNGVRPVASSFIAKTRCFCSGVNFLNGFGKVSLFSLIASKRSVAAWSTFTPPTSASTWPASLSPPTSTSPPASPASVWAGVLPPPFFRLRFRLRLRLGLGLRLGLRLRLGLGLRLRLLDGLRLLLLHRVGLRLRLGLLDGLRLRLGLGRVRHLGCRRVGLGRLRGKFFKSQSPLWPLF